MIYEGKYYFYVKNLQGDIVSIVDESGTAIVNYSYDSWGRLLQIEGSKKDAIGILNPFRYRGYYYDTEIGMYYLKNRYYDPEIRRFICADDLEILDTQEDLYDKNIYIYCDDNPVSRIDDGGDIWSIAIPAGLDNIWNPVGWAILGGAAAGGLIYYGTRKRSNRHISQSRSSRKERKKSKSDPNPYGRAKQKKQGRENRNKARESDKFKSRNNRRDGKPAKPKSHTPSKKGHNKGFNKKK